MEEERGVAVTHREIEVRVGHDVLPRVVVGGRRVDLVDVVFDVAQALGDDPLAVEVARDRVREDEAPWGGVGYPGSVLDDASRVAITG